MTIHELYTTLLVSMFGKNIIKIGASSGTNALKKYLYRQVESNDSAKAADMYDAVSNNHIFINCLKTVLNDLYIDYSFLIINENGKNMQKYINLHRLELTSGSSKKKEDSIYDIANDYFRFFNHKGVAESWENIPSDKERWIELYYEMGTLLAYALISQCSEIRTDMIFMNRDKNECFRTIERIRKSGKDSKDYEEKLEMLKNSLNAKAKEYEEKNTDLRSMLNSYLEELGTEKIDFNYKYSNHYFDLITTDKNGMISDPITRLFMVALVTKMKMIGRKKDETAIKEQFGIVYKHIFMPYEYANNALVSAENILFESVKDFSPRGMDEVRKMADIFVMPEFARDADPVNYLNNGISILISGASGLGKSMYVNALTGSVINHKLLQGIELTGEAAEMGKTMNKHVLSITSKMFIYAYRKNYLDTDDFVQLFFRCIWAQQNELATNFYYDGIFRTSREYGEYEFNEEIREYMQHLAGSGELILVLDAFDEITKPVREVYLRMAENTRSEYPGIIFLATSRVLTNSMMKLLRDSCGIERTSTILISPFSNDQQKQLLNKWKNVLNGDNRKLDNLVEKLKTNEYYKRFAKNPFMLSILIRRCFVSDSIHDAIRRTISEFIGRYDRLHENDTFRVIKNDLKDIYTLLALIMVEKGDTEISKARISSFLLKNYLDGDKNLKEEATDILTAEGGLLKPVEGTIDDYSFLVEDFEYELVAGYLVEKYEDDKDGLLETIRKITVFDSNTALFTPLLCSYEDYRYGDMFEVLRYLKELYAERERARNDISHIVKVLKEDSYGYSLITDQEFELANPEESRKMKEMLDSIEQYPNPF